MSGPKSKGSLEASALRINSTLVTTKGEFKFVVSWVIDVTKLTAFNLTVSFKNFRALFN